MGWLIVTDTRDDEVVAYPVAVVAFSVDLKQYLDDLRTAIGRAEYESAKFEELAKVSGKMEELLEEARDRGAEVGFATGFSDKNGPQSVEGMRAHLQGNISDLKQGLRADILIYHGEHRIPAVLMGYESTFHEAMNTLHRIKNGAEKDE